MNKDQKQDITEASAATKPQKPISYAQLLNRQMKLDEGYSSKGKPIGYKAMLDMKNTNNRTVIAWNNGLLEMSEVLENELQR